MSFNFDNQIFQRKKTKNKTRQKKPIILIHLFDHHHYHPYNGIFICFPSQLSIKLSRKNFFVETTTTTIIDIKFVVVVVVISDLIMMMMMAVIGGKNDYGSQLLTIINH